MKELQCLMRYSVPLYIFSKNAFNTPFMLTYTHRHKLDVSRAGNFWRTRALLRRRVARGQWGQLPPPNSESCAKNFQVNQAFDVLAKEIFQGKSPKMLAIT